MKKMIQIELFKMKTKTYEIKNTPWDEIQDEMSKKKKISETWNIVPWQKYNSSSKMVERRK